MKNFLKSKPGKILLPLLVVGLIFSGIYASRNAGKFLPKNSAIQESDAGYRMIDKTKSLNPISKTSISNNALDTQDSKILHHAKVSINIEKESFMSVFNEINASAKSMGGYIKDANYTENRSTTVGYVTVLIPTEELDNFIQYIKSIGKTESFQLATEDRSSEYFDLQGRLKILESQRSLLISWLNKAKTVNEMLNIRRELEKVEEEIEKTEGKIKYLDFHTKYSDVFIQLKKATPNPNNSPILNFLKNSFEKAINGLLYSFVWIVILLIWFVPYGIVIYIIYLVVKRKHEKS